MKKILNYILIVSVSVLALYRTVMSVEKIYIHGHEHTQKGPFTWKNLVKLVSIHFYVVTTYFLLAFVGFLVVITPIYCPYIRSFQIFQIFDVGFKDPASPVMEGIIDFHHEIIFMLIPIIFIVGSFLYRILILGNRKFNGVLLAPVHTVLETIWTIIPIIILFFTVIPSFALLYGMNDLVNPVLTFKAIGNQWFWQYEYTDEFSFYGPQK